MTQPAFNLEALKNVQEYRAKLPMVVGVMVLRDLQHARRIAQVPGVTVPEAVFTRLHQYESEADQAQAGIELCHRAGPLATPRGLDRPLSYVAFLPSARTQATQATQARAGLKFSRRKSKAAPRSLNWPSNCASSTAASMALNRGPGA
jgi:hypothetical protein